MGVVIGFAVGYVFGTRAGREGYEQLRGAVRDIAESENVRDVVGSAISVVGDIMRAGQGVVADRPAPLRSIA